MYRMCRKTTFSLLYNLLTQDSLYVFAEASLQLETIYLYLSDDFIKNYTDLQMSWRGSVNNTKQI